jgi:hypothetical protein
MRLFRISTLIALCFLFLGGFLAFASPVYASSGSSAASKPVFVWMFGYTGDTFVPQSQLGISTTQFVSQVKSISNAVGKSNLRLVSVIGEEPGHNIQSGSEAAIKAFVGQLKPYASVLYGRIDLQEFNTKSSPTLQSQVALFESLGVNGVWLDEGPNLWHSMGSPAFNSMIQNLVKAYPSLNIIMNQAVNKGGADGGWITPAKGTTWGSHTYISPSVNAKSCCTVNAKTISTMNKIYPGRVLLHFDANAQISTEPMGIFALKTPSQQESTVQNLVNEGKSQNFDFQFPVLGAWTYNGSKYHGDLYNSLASGTDHQGTESSFVNTMKSLK